MTRRRRRATIVALLLAGAPLAPPVGAQGSPPGERTSHRPSPEMGMRGGYDAQLDAGTAGGQLRYPIGPFMEVLASGDYVLVGEAVTWQANADAGFRFLPTEAVYGGVGVAVTQRVFEQNVVSATSDMRVGLNLLAGVALSRRMASPIRPYAETRWTFVQDRDSQFSLVAGLNIRLGTQ